MLKLSFLSKPARVYRGVKEDTMQLPDDFLDAPPGKFAGGTELAFMSTTTDPEVAVTYSGKGPGSIFIMDFDGASRGASLQFLSQFPHEAELLPCRWPHQAPRAPVDPDVVEEGARHGQ